MVSQPRHWSFIESVVGVLIGYLVALVTQIIVFPLFGISVGIEKNLLLGAVFTAVAIPRVYLVRRLFNWLHLRWGWRMRDGSE